MSLGLAGEVGELLDALKKFAIYGKPLDQANVIEELGDIEFYLAGVRDELRIDRQTCLAANVAKLSKRYPTGSYTNSQAIERADKRDGEGSSS
jgi:NTP pyrophosphatase (non-canonical NTP hydrolase)